MRPCLRPSRSRSHWPWRPDALPTSISGRAQVPAAERASSTVPVGFATLQRGPAKEALPLSGLAHGEGVDVREYLEVDRAASSPRSCRLRAERRGTSWILTAQSAGVSVTSCFASI
jgi:hypothetical protein